MPAPAVASTLEWAGWRGAGRDGHVSWLPDKLPAKAEPVWSIDVITRGLGGVAATKDYVIYSDRGLNDTTDIFRCLSASNGKEVWTITYPAVGNLDYGNSPRATPLIVGEYVYLLGAFGHLTCAELKSGKTVWDLNLKEEFDVAEEQKWGVSSSPLYLEGKLIVNPGAKEASIAALDPNNGKTLWKTPGKPAGYGSLIGGVFGGVKQIVGYDSDSLGGWDVKTGKRIWRLVPDRPNDFNVPTPIAVGDRLLVSTENNGTRLYQFREGGIIAHKPVAVSRKLAPDTHTPVVVGNRVFGVWRRLVCLDLHAELRAIWDSEQKGFATYCAVVATDSRVLVITLNGELILADAKGAEFNELGRLQVLADEKGLYSHPAFVGTRIYVRGSSSLICLELKTK